MFTKADVSSTILGLAKSRYGVPIVIQKGATFESLKFDKYDVLYLVMASEEHFGVHITNEEVVGISSVHALITVVCSKLNDLGLLDAKKKHVEKTETVEEQEAKEAMEDAKSNDGVPTVKTEGDFEREDLEEEQKAKEAEEQKQSMNTTESEKLPEPPEEIKVETEKVPAEQPAPVVAESESAQ